MNLEVSAFRSLAARDPNPMMLPVRIAECRVPLLMTGIKWVDAVNVGFDAAIDAIAATLGAPAHDLPTPAPGPQLAERLHELLSQGKALFAQAKYAEAALFLERVTRQEPNNAEAWAYLGRSYNGANRYQQGLVAGERAVTIDPTITVGWYASGRALNGHKRSEEALACYDRALALDPTYSMAWTNKGAVLTDLKRSEEAVVCFDRALALDPKDAYAWTGKGMALRALGRTAEAERVERVERRARELGWTG